MPTLLSLLVSASLAALTASAQTSVPGKGARVLQPFDYHGVTLDAGPLRRQVDEVRDYYLRIPNDDLLKGFRARAGSPALGVDLGGWYTEDTFHVFGQLLSGLARLYAATGDPACRDKADALLKEWGKCIGPDGYFYFSTHPNAPHYIYDKMVGGLVDMHLYCGSQEALGLLSRITDWAVKNLVRGRPYADGAADTEWYTLSENLYRAYLATGDPKYRDFAEVWEYTEYWDLYAQKLDLFGVRPSGGQTGAYHAYSHVNTLGGAGAAYLVKGEQGYLDTLINAYDYLQEHECFATGGYGPNEQLLPSERLPGTLLDWTNHFETQCGSWAALKMSKYLISLTGDARFGDWVERLVINGIGASIPMSADGRVFYYSEYNLNGSAKRNTGFGWSCCTGTRPMAVADYDDLIYFRDADTLYVNLYTPSTVVWDRPGAPVTVRQQTRFPEGSRVEFTVSVARPTRFGLGLRWPGWLASPMTAALNGKPTKLGPDARHWATIRREWREGDRLTVDLPMNLHPAPLLRDHKYPAAIMCGPVVLAVRSPDASPHKVIDTDHLDEALVPSLGEPLTYHVAADPSLLVRPFYAFKEGETYFVYLDPTAPTRISYHQLTFTGNWNDGGIFRYTNAVGATAGCSFEGTGVRWLGQKFDDAGRGEVTIDGKVVAVVDQYGPGRGLPFSWEHQGLAPGKHTIKITLLEERTPESKDRFINVAGFEIIQSAAPPP